jgi:hypothetical protein
MRLYVFQKKGDYFPSRHQLKVVLQQTSQVSLQEGTGLKSIICLHHKHQSSKQIGPCAGTALVSEPHHLVTIRNSLLWLERPQR